MSIHRDSSSFAWLPHATTAIAGLGGVLACFGLIDLWRVALSSECDAIAGQLTVGVLLLLGAMLARWGQGQTLDRDRASYPPAWFYDAWLVVDCQGVCVSASSPFWLVGVPPCAVGESIFASELWDDAAMRELRGQLETAIEAVLTRRERQVWDTFVAGSDRCCTIYVTPHDKARCVAIWVREDTPSEPLLQSRFFRKSLDLFCIAKTTGHFAYLNASWERLGYDRDELLAHPFLEFVHPRDRAATKLTFDRLLREERVENFHNRYRMANGEYQWLSWTASFDRTIGAIYAVARDITSWKSTQSSLDGALDNYRALTAALQLSPVSIFFIDRTGECRFCQGASVLSDTGEATIARGENLFARLDRDSETYVALHRALDGEEQRWLVVEGDRYLQYHARPLRIKPQKIGGVVGMLQDVTPEQRANREWQSQVAQQAAVAQLGREALEANDIAILGQRATELLAQVFGVEYSGLFELLPSGQAFLLRAGVGWKPGLLGVACVGMRDSLICHSFQQDRVVFVEDFRVETRFSGPPLLHNHRVVSGMCLRVGDRESPFGVLGVYSKSPLTFSQRDATFLQTIANVLGTAISRCQSEVRLHLMDRAIAATSTGIAIADVRLPDTPIVYTNAAFEKITGYSAEEAIGRNCRFLQGEDTDKEPLAEVRSALLHGRECNVLLKNYRRNGQVFWNNLYLAPIHDANRCLTHFVGVQNDVTDLIETETALRNSERRLDSILSSLDAAIWSVDAHTGRMLYINPAVEEIYGRGLQEFYRDPALWQQAIHPDDRVRVQTERQSLQHLDRVEMEYRIVRPLGEVRWLYSRCCRVEDERGDVVRYDGIDTDVTDIKQAEAQLRHNAFYDRLTDLPNRALFLDRLEHTIQRSKRRGGFMFAVLFFDLDGFKIVNDSLGHLAGDLLLVEIARRLEACLRPSDTLARLGGDEFTVLLEDLLEIESATQVAERMLAALQQPFHIFERDVFVNASIGITLGCGHHATVPERGESVGCYLKPVDVVRDADIAMYRAKASGKGQYCIFDREMHAEAVSRLQLETALRGAIDAEQLRVFYQPTVDLRTRRVNGFEALVRWIHPELGFVLPSDFIPIAEETGEIVKIGAWVLERACHQLRAWQKTFAGIPEFADVTMAVNLSVRQFAQSDLLGSIDRVLEDTQLDPRSLKLEITESAIVGNPAAALHILQALHDRDLTLCLDDFGTGYSSLSYLHRFPVNVLKIDRSFVTDIDTGEKNRDIVHAIVQLAHHLNMKTIAEGIETEAECEVLRRFNCDSGQGYLFARPLDPKAATSFLCEQMLKLEAASSSTSFPTSFPTSSPASSPASSPE